MERTYPFFRFAQRSCFSLTPVVCAALLVAAAGAQPAADWTIDTVAGGGDLPTDEGSGTAGAAQLSFPQAVAADGEGNLYIADTNNLRILKVDAAGNFSTFAGNGTLGYGGEGDGSQATAAPVNYPKDIALDGDGNLYIVDDLAHLIRKVDASTNIISTVAGTGTQGSDGDGEQAIEAQLNSPRGVAVDSAGNIYIADTGNHRIRMVATGTNIISTVAGTGTQGSDGDGGQATEAELNSPRSVAVDGSGNLYIADRDNHRIRKVTAAGIITTLGKV